MKFNGRRGTLTYNLEVTGLTLHRIGVNLAHVPSPVGFFHLSYVEEPRPVIAVRDCYSMILRDDVTGYRQYRLGVHAQPCHLQQNWRIKKKEKLSFRLSISSSRFARNRTAFFFFDFARGEKRKEGRSSRIDIVPSSIEIGEACLPRARGLTTWKKKWRVEKEK